MQKEIQITHCYYSLIEIVIKTMVDMGIEMCFIVLFKSFPFNKWARKYDN